MLLASLALSLLTACGGKEKKEATDEQRKNLGAPHLVFNNLTVHDTVAVNDTTRLIYTLANRGFTELKIDNVLPGSSFCEIIFPKSVAGGKPGAIVGKCIWDQPGEYRGTFEVHSNSGEGRPMVLTYQVWVMAK